MTIKVEELEPKYLETLHSMLIAMCLDGECYAFAIALSRGLGWPMMGLIHKNEIRHAAVLTPDEKFWDARGAVNEAEFGKPFGVLPPYDLRPITEDDLQRVKPVHEYLMESILKKAQIVWPNLPWKADALKYRVLLFAKELEELSRKHGLWIYGSFPTALPVITEGQGNETGYELKPTIDGSSFFFNRTLS